jgi:endonuclease/exonuclease/phosphatase family metal-dependent hydrolase
MHQSQAHFKPNFTTSSACDACTNLCCHVLCQVIQQLQQVDADVLSLQEVDIGCERSSCRDTGAAIAQALQLNYLFVCENWQQQQQQRCNIVAVQAGAAVQAMAAAEHKYNG